MVTIPSITTPSLVTNGSLVKNVFGQTVVGTVNLRSNRDLKGQVQGWGWFLTRFPLKLAENADVGETVIWGLEMHEKKRFLLYWKHHHDAQITLTICLLRHSGESLQNGQLSRAPKTKLILCPRDPQGYSHISLSLSGRISKEYRNIVSASKQTPSGIPWGLRNRTHWSTCYTNGHEAAQQESQLICTV